MPYILTIAYWCTIGLLPGQLPTVGPTATTSIECARDHGYTPAWCSPSWVSAYCAETAHQTFFAYVSAEGADPVRVGAYDHAAGTVCKPAILPLAARTASIDGLWLTLDDQGHVWVCVSTGEGSPSTLFKSTKPYMLDSFARRPGPALAQPQLWQVPGQGFLLIGLRKDAQGPAPYFATSPDGQTWAEPVKLAALDAGHTFMTARHMNKIGVALAGYAAGEDASAATNVYYLETSDAGRTWQDVRRVNLKLPVTSENTGVLAWEYRSIQWTALLRDMCFAANGRPVILYLNGRPTTPGAPPAAAWTTVRFVPRGWDSTGLLLCSALSDQGQLYLEPANAWRLLTARNAVPLPDRETLVAWTTEDQGRSWYKRAAISTDATSQQILVRPVNAQPECYALWLTAGEVLPPASQPSATTQPAIASRPAAPPRLLLLTRDTDALLLPTTMSDTNEKPSRGPTTNRPG